MKKSLLVLFVMLLPLPPILLGQGSLTPPGAPAPTMKSLDQIEPRTLISSLPFTITKSGHYYLAANLTGSTASAGITVNSVVGGVTIDLNGFSLSGGGGTNIPAITVSFPGVLGFCVRNGTITGWSGNGIDAGQAVGAIYEKLRIIQNTGTGLVTGGSCNIRSCVFNNGHGAGLQTGLGCTIDNCTCASNVLDAITTNDGNTITNCTAYFNGGSGIHAGSSCLITNCLVVSDQTSGSPSGILTGNACRVANCSSQGNGTSGISVDTGSVVEACLARTNLINGITATNNCSVVSNTCSSNNVAGGAAHAGILVTGNNNTIDSNCSTSNNNGIGIATPSGTHNLIIRNRCSGNGGGNYQVGSSAFGPVIDMSAGGAISSASGTVNPWTNWIF